MKTFSRRLVDTTYDEKPGFRTWPYLYPDGAFSIVYAGADPLFAIGGKSFGSYSLPAGSGSESVEACHRVKRSGLSIARHFSNFKVLGIDPRTWKPRALGAFPAITLENIPLVNELTDEAITQVMLISRLQTYEYRIASYETYLKRCELRGESTAGNWRVRKLARARVEEARLQKLLS